MSRVAGVDHAIVLQGAPRDHCVGHTYVVGLRVGEERADHPGHRQIERDDLHIAALQARVEEGSQACLPPRATTPHLHHDRRGNVDEDPVQLGQLENCTDVSVALLDGDEAAGIQGQSPRASRARAYAASPGCPNSSFSAFSHSRYSSRPWSLATFSASASDT